MAEMSRSEKRYGGKAETKEEPKAEAPAAEATDKEGGKEAPGGGMPEKHAGERGDMAKKHEKERRDMHGDHREAMRKMHDRHEGEHKAMLDRHVAEAASGGGSADGDMDQMGTGAPGAAEE